MAQNAEAQGRDHEPESVGMLQTGDLSARVMRRARASVRGTDREGKSGPMAKLGMELALLYYQSRAEGASGVQSLRQSAIRPKRAASKATGREAYPRAVGSSANGGTDGSPGGAPRRLRAQVLSPLSADGQSVYVNAIASGDPERLLVDLQDLGLAGGEVAGSVVSGRLPIGRLQDAAQASGLRGMVPAYAQTHVGSVGSEADTAHAAPEARSEAGTNGSGQKVCVLSDSYDQDESAETTASSDIQSGDLPGPGNPIGNTTPVDVVDEGGDGNTDEGRAMLQLIHDIAPGAELGFHTAFGGLAVFAQGIGDLADAGCTVIVDDIRYNIEPFYQDGPVSKAVNEVVESEGVPYFTSAGNDGQNSYEAPFRDSGEPGILDSSSVAHDFDPSSGTDTRQKIALEAGGRFRIFAFQWTDPSSVVEGSKGADTDIDVALVNDAGTVVASSSSDNIATGIPLESIDYTNDTGSSQVLNLTVEKFAGPDPEEIKYVYSGSGYDIQEYDTLGPTVYGHPVAERAVAVAAAPFFNTAAYNSFASPATLESFSSKGGIPILFDQDGDRISGIARRKPDVTGTDGVDNTFFGVDISDSAIGGIDSDPHPNFFGTSAAAPNVAAIAALVQAVRPGLSPTGVRDRLESTAGDITSRQRRDGEFVEIDGGEGVDPWSGHGFVRADRAVPAAQNGPPALSLSPDSGSIDENNSPPSAVASISIDDPDGGTNNLSLSGDDAGSFRVDSTDLEFTVAADFESKSSYSVTVEVNDPDVDPSPNDSQSFTLSINDVNEAPVISDFPEADTIGEDSSTGLIGFSVSDPDGDSLELSVRSENPDLVPGDSAEIDRSVPAVMATPSPDSNGTSDIELTASDGQKTTASTLGLAVLPVNDPPAASADSFETAQDSALTVAAPGVLGNDSDPDGDALSAALVSGARNGNLTLREDGSFEYVPSPGFSGEDSFTYRALDDSSAADTASARVVVLPPPEPPEGLSASADGEAISLGWGEPVAEDVARYRIYRSTAPIDSSAGPSALSAFDSTAAGETSYRDTSVTPGRTYYYRATAVDTGRVEGGLSKETAAAPKDLTPPAVPEGLAAGLEGRQISLTWSEVASEDLAGYRLYRSAGRSPDTSGAGLTEELISETTFTDTTATENRTYRYGVTAVDTAGNESVLSAETSVFRYPSQIQAEVSRSFGEAAGPGDYRLVALPGEGSRPIADVISGEAGSEWQAYRDDGSQEDFFQKYDGSSDFAFEPGNGFWVTATSDLAFEDSVSTVPLEGDSAATIPLREGWNVISNPTGKPVEWARVREANPGSLQPLFGFEGTFSQADSLKAATSGRAYYLFNGSADRTELVIPYPGSPPSPTSKTESRAFSTAGQEANLLSLSATPVGSEGPTSTVQVGVQSETAGSVVAPPSRFEAVSLRIKADEKQAGRSGLLVTERREGDGETFHLQLKSEEGVPVSISASGLGEAESVALIRPSAGKTHRLRADETVQIEGSQDRTALRLAVGTEGYVDGQANQVIPDEVTFTSYPNPVQKQATVEYTLPERADVRVALYDVLGRRVATLEEGSKQAGRHRIQLERTGLSSGVYFGRLEAGGQTRTQKITVVR